MSTPFTKIARKSIFYTIFILLFGGCGDDRTETFPYAYVNVTIDLQNPRYLDLLNVSGSAIVENEGYNRNGILVFRNGIDEFKAYDCTCTFNISANCAIEKNENSIVSAICPCCSSNYELISGSVSVGPSVIPLKEYQVSSDGVLINIRN